MIKDGVMGRMKIMHLCLCGPYSDRYEYQDNLLPQKHHEMGFEVKVLVSQETWEEDGKKGFREPQTYINDYGYIIQVLPYSNGAKAQSYRKFVGLYDTIKSFNPDILFCHGGLTVSFKDIERYLKKNRQVKFFMDSHVDYNISGINHVTGLARKKRYFLYRYIWGHCVRSLSKYAVTVWGVTPARVNFLRDVFKIPEDKLGLLVMGADENKIDISSIDEKKRTLRNSLGLKETTLLLITGGKLDKYKNIPQLLSAMYLLRTEDVHLAIFGTPSEDTRDEINEKLSMLDNVTMLGWANSDQITDYFLGADLAVFPGRHSVLWEKAIACGLPCLILHADGMEHVDVGGNCMFFRQEEPAIIEENIRYLIRNPEQLSRMREVALHQGVKEFSYDHIASKSIGMEEGV